MVKGYVLVIKLTQDSLFLERMFTMKQFHYVAYSGIRNDKGAINTAEHYRYVGGLPFTFIKGDVRPTSDGGVIMCHDAGFTLDADGRITKFDRNNCKRILEMTTEQCLALEHAQQYDGQYCRIVDIETYIRICKESSKPPFITVRDEEIETLAPTVLKLLEGYGLINSAIINSFTVRTLEIFRQLCPEIRLSNVLPARKPVERSDVETAVRLQNCLLNAFHFTVRDMEAEEATMNASRDAMAYAASKGVDIYQAIVNDASVIKDLMERGFSGAQICILPSNFE